MRQPAGRAAPPRPLAVQQDACLPAFLALSGALCLRARLCRARPPAAGLALLKEFEDSLARCTTLYCDDQLARVAPALVRSRTADPLALRTTLSARAPPPDLRGEGPWARRGRRVKEAGAEHGRPAFVRGSAAVRAAASVPRPPAPLPGVIRQARGGGGAGRARGASRAGVQPARGGACGGRLLA